MSCVIGPIEKLGTQWWFEFFDISEEIVQKLQKSIEQYMEEFENRYSRFRADSWLSVLNQTGSYQNPHPEFIDLLEIALEAYEKTGGIFNIAVGATLEARGYDADYSFKGTAQDQIEVPALEKVLSISTKEIVLTKGVHLDFGGFGKGYLIDALARYLEEEWGIQHYLINGGGDMYATLDEHNQPLEIVLQNPREKNKEIGRARLSNQAFAASSPHLRTWRDAQGTQQHHLVGNTGTEAQSSFVVAPQAVWADIYATVCAIDPTYIPPQEVEVHRVK